MFYMKHWNQRKNHTHTHTWTRMIKRAQKSARVMLRHTILHLQKLKRLKKRNFFLLIWNGESNGGNDDDSGIHSIPRKLSSRPKLFHVKRTQKIRTFFSTTIFLLFRLFYVHAAYFVWVFAKNLQEKKTQHFIKSFEKIVHIRCKFVSANWTFLAQARHSVALAFKRKKFQWRQINQRLLFDVSSEIQYKKKSKWMKNRKRWMK